MFLAALLPLPDLGYQYWHGPTLFIVAVAVLLSACTVVRQITPWD